MGLPPRFLVARDPAQRNKGHTDCSEASGADQNANLARRPALFGRQPLFGQVAAHALDKAFGVAYAFPASLTAGAHRLLAALQLRLDVLGFHPTATPSRSTIRQNGALVDASRPHSAFV